MVFAGCGRVQLLDLHVHARLGLSGVRTWRQLPRARRDLSPSFSASSDAARFTMCSLPRAVAPAQGIWRQN